MRVLLLGMDGDFADGAASGMVKYAHGLYTELNRIKGVRADKIEFAKLTKKLPWLNHSSFYFQSKFANLKDYDVLHKPNDLRIFTKPRGSKLVTTIHNTIAATGRVKILKGSLKESAIAMNGRLSDIVANIGRRTSFDSDYIIADTHHGKEEILEYADGAYDRNRICVVPLGIDNDFIHGEPKARKGSKFRIGYLGSFNQYQHVDSGIRAVRMMHDRDICYELWGDKTIEAGFLEKDIGNDKRIYFCGKIAQEKKVALYESFDVFLHTGIYEGLPIWEAMARGVPIVVFKNVKMDPGTRRHCFMAEDEEDIARIISKIKSDGYSESKRKAAMNYVRQFTWKRTAEKTLEVYQKALKSG